MDTPGAADPRRTRLVLSALAVVGLVAVSVAAATTAPRTPERPWAASLAEADAALDRGDVATARGMWADARGLAIRARSWSALVACGEMALRLGETSPPRTHWQQQARRLFLAALVRARAAGSAQGVLAAAAGFARLGDQEVAEQGMRLARSLGRVDVAGQVTDPAPPPATATPEASGER